MDIARGETALIHYDSPEIPGKGQVYLDVRPELHSTSRNTYKNVHELLKESTGTIKYDILDHGIVLNICLRANAASQFDPIRFTLHVGKEISTDSAVKPKEVNLEEEKELKLSQMKADRQMNDVVKQLARELEIAQKLTKEINLTKELEFKLFDIGNKMNRMSGWFPILKMMILVIGGFLQFQQMMSFLKKRNIF